MPASTISRTSLTARYVRELADLLGLRDWAIVLDEEPAEEEYDAYINMTAGQRRAVLRIGPSHWKDTPEEQRHTLVHELLHPHFHEAQAIVERNASMLGVTGQVLGAEHKNFIEHGVDAVAVAISPFFPLPPEASDAEQERRPEEGTVRGPGIAEQDGQAGVPDRHTGQSS